MALFHEYLLGTKINTHQVQIIDNKKNNTADVAEQTSIK